MIFRPHSQMHPALQLLFFLIVTVLAIILGGLAATAIVSSVYGMQTVIDVAHLRAATPDAVRALWIFQIVSTTIPLLIIPLFFALVVVKEPSAYLKWDVRFPPVLLIVIFLLMFISLPIVEVLANLNQRMVLPDFLKGLEQWMKASEHEAEQATKIILKMDTPIDLVKVLLLVAATTAVVEEFMFRGALQTIFTRWTQNPHTAIWITAILFSAFHMEFYGFLPRVMLGVFFGYFVYWSGSIWTSVWAHFINNGTAVVLTYLFQHKLIKDNPDTAQSFSYLGYVFSVMITLLLLINYRSIATKTNQQHNT